MSFFGPQLTPLPSGKGKHVFITGATGVVGAGAVESFRAAGWDKITCCSRRKPDYDLTGIDFVPMDLLDREACDATIKNLPDLTHVVYTAVIEKPISEGGAVVAGWKDEAQMNDNFEALRNCLDPLVEHCPKFQSIQFMQGGKAYGVHVGLTEFSTFPQRERAPRVVHPNFYWLQEDYIKEKLEQGNGNWSWTCWRPPYIIGHAKNGNLSALDALAAYAALCSQQSEPMQYNGTTQMLATAVDARLLGRAFVWATAAPAARNEHFNIDNGDVFLMENVYRRVAEVFGLQLVLEPERPFRFEEELLSEKSKRVWRAAAAEHGLEAPDIESWLANSAQFMDWATGAVGYSGEGATKKKPPARNTLRTSYVSSQIKLRQAGFADCMDTEDMFVEWIEHMIETKALPPPPVQGQKQPAGRARL